MAVLLLQLAGDFESPVSQRTGPEFRHFVCMVPSDPWELLTLLVESTGTPTMCRVLRLSPTPSTTHQPVDHVISPSGTDWPWFVPESLQEPAVQASNSTVALTSGESHGIGSQGNTQYRNTNVSPASTCYLAGWFSNHHWK